MLQVFFGNDTIRVRQEALRVVEKFREEGLAMEFITPEDYQRGSLSKAVADVSLFGSRWVYLIDNPSLEVDMEEELMAVLPSIAESQNVFIIVEGPLFADRKKAFAKYTTQLEEYKRTAGKTFNSFLLADAFLKRDKKGLWLLFHEAKLSGALLEELVGVIWWQIKVARLAQLTGSADEAGIKEYPYSKAKRSLNKFKVGELEELSLSFITLVHESRLGLRDLDFELERWILRL